DVLVVVSPADYGAVLGQLDRAGGPSREFRFDLARKAFAHTGSYDTAIASELLTITADDDGFTRAPSTPPATLTLALRKLRDLRYGENPHQQAAWYAERSEERRVGKEGGGGWWRTRERQGEMSR